MTDISFIEKTENLEKVIIVHQKKVLEVFDIVRIDKLISGIFIQMRMLLIL